MAVGQTVAAGQTVATIAPSRTGIKIGWWAPNPGPAARRVDGYTEGHGTPAGAEFRYRLEQLGANPRDGLGVRFPQRLEQRCVCGTEMRKLM